MIDIDYYTVLILFDSDLRNIRDIWSMDKVTIRDFPFHIAKKLMLKCVGVIYVSRKFNDFRILKYSDDFINVKILTTEMSNEEG